MHWQGHTFIHKYFQRQDKTCSLKGVGVGVRMCPSMFNGIAFAALVIRCRLLHGQSLKKNTCGLLSITWSPVQSRDSRRGTTVWGRCSSNHCGGVNWLIVERLKPSPGVSRDLPRPITMLFYNISVVSTYLPRCFNLSWSSDWQCGDLMVAEQKWAMVLLLLWGIMTM